MAINAVPVDLKGYSIHPNDLRDAFVTVLEFLKSREDAIWGELCKEPNNVLLQCHFDELCGLNGDLNHYYNVNVTTYLNGLQSAKQGVLLSS